MKRNKNALPIKTEAKETNGKEYLTIIKHERSKYTILVDYKR